MQWVDLWHDPHPHWGAAFKVALFRYRFLAEAFPEDFRQSVSLACRENDFKPGAMRSAIDRVMYRMARDYGFCRPSAGLKRGVGCGKWTNQTEEIERRCKANS